MLTNSKNYRLPAAWLSLWLLLAGGQLPARPRPKAQGLIEYLLITAIIVVIILVVVGAIFREQLGAFVSQLFAMMFGALSG